MKKLLLMLIIILFSLFAFTSFAEEIFFGITSPVKTNFNFSIQNGPTPNLQKYIIKESNIPENNLMEELEAERIKIKVTQICA